MSFSPRDRHHGAYGDASGKIQQRIKEVYAEPDRARMAHLDRLIKEQSRCRYCNAKLSDAALDRHPGICSRPACLRQARKDALNR